MTKIEGILRLTTPLHVAAHEAGWRLSDTRFPTRSENNSKPLTRMARQQMLLPTSIRLEEASYVSGDVPFIGGNGFRGAMRRYAQRRVQKSIGPVSVSVYHGLSCGAVSGRPEKDSVTIAGMAAARKNIYMGLFGGSPSMFQSYYRAYDCVPVTAATVALRRVPMRYHDQVPMRWHTPEGGERVLREMRPDELLTYIDFNRVDDVLRFRDPDAPNAIRNYEEEFIAWADKVHSNREDVAKNKEARTNAKAKGKKGESPDRISKFSLDAMSAIEVVATGTKMYFRIDLDPSLDDAQQGLMMLCVADMVKHDRLGGWGRIGLGTFIPELEVVMADGQRAPLLPSEGEEGGELHGDLAVFEEAAHDSLAALDPAVMSSFFQEA